jgi:PAS domain S-box-containing protein
MNNNVAQLRADIDPLASLDPVLLGALTAGAHEMISILDPQQRILWCGGAVEAISGYSPQERIGQLAIHFVHPDDRDYALERTREFIANAAAQSRSETMSIRTLHRDGGYRHVEIAGTRLLRRGAPALLVIHTRDVTQEARALERSARAELRLETALWGAEVFVWQLDNSTGELTTLGEAAFEKRGIDACGGSEHVERWLQQVHPDDLPALQDVYARQDAGITRVSRSPTGSAPAAATGPGCSSARASARVIRMGRHGSSAACACRSTTPAGSSRTWSPRMSGCSWR